MKSNKYFQIVEINQEVFQKFLSSHIELTRWFDVTKPFYFRVDKKLFACLLSRIIEQDETSNNVMTIESTLEKKIKSIKPKKLLKLSLDELIQIVGNEEKAKTIYQVTKDIVEGKLDLDELSKQLPEVIVERLRQYPFIKTNTIKQFAIFGCYKKNIICDEDPHFIEGLKTFLQKNEITKEDINKIYQDYTTDGTFFTLCMWGINNVRSK